VPNIIPPAAVSAVAEAAPAVAESVVAAPAPPAAVLSAAESTPKPFQNLTTPATVAVHDTTSTHNAPDVAPSPLLEQRLAAAQTMLAKNPAGSASIQLYYTSNLQPSRIEGFLTRADNLGVLQDIYVLPIKINGRKGLRVLYGVYANNEKALAAIQQLPKRYLDAYAPSIYQLKNSTDF
jgi:septal ring-binding cell division protein DamX